MGCVADGTKSVVNHNPIPDVLHDEFVRLLSPLLIPPPPSSGTEPDMTQAPFEWLHFEVSYSHVSLSRCDFLSNYRAPLLLIKLACTDVVDVS